MSNACMVAPPLSLAVMVQGLVVGIELGAVKVAEVGSVVLGVMVPQLADQFPLGMGALAVNVCVWFSTVVAGDAGGSPG